MDINELVIDKNCTLLECLDKLNASGKKVLYCADDGVLIASITDGDIRRYILKNESLEAKVWEVANFNPKYCHYNCSRKKIKENMIEYSIESIPLVDNDKKIVRIVFWNDIDIEKQKEKIHIPVVIMAGGQGTRLYPYTKILPKPLIPIGDIPISEHIINHLHSYGCDIFYMVVNCKKNMIKAYYNEIQREYNIEYIEEDRPLGTGGGLSLLKGKIDGTFILTNCDILIDDDISDIYRYHVEEQNIVTMVASLQDYIVPYGVIKLDDMGTLVEIKEKPKFSFFTNTGFYILESEVLDELEDDVCIGFPNVIEKYIRDRSKKIGVYPISSNMWHDMGEMDKLIKMKYEFEE